MFSDRTFLLMDCVTTTWLCSKTHCRKLKLICPCCERSFCHTSRSHAISESSGVGICLRGRNGRRRLNLVVVSDEES